MAGRMLAGALAVACLTQGTPEASARCSTDAVCSGGPARIMLILDASSDMLNNGASAGAMGNTDWDLFRAILAGTDGTSLYDLPVDDTGPVASEVVHFGLIAYGDAAPSPGEQVRVVDYGPCTRPNVEWALDPMTSCVSPGCTDPWGGPPIEWTSLDGSQEDPPGFALETISHMPRCDGAGNGCEGSGRYVHLGVELATSNHVAYAANPPFDADDGTVYANVLLVDGPYRNASTDQEVQDALEASYAAGVTTYVVGFGAGAQVATPQFVMELEDMASWGSGGTKTHYQALNNFELQDALEAILRDLDLPCCKRIDCSPVGGATGGGSGGGTDTDGGGGADSWGSASGSGSASDSASASGSASAGGGTDSSGAIDDDGGCSCRSTAPVGAAVWCLPVLFLRRRRIRTG